MVVFGSIVCGESTPGVEFEGPATFDAYMDTRFFLEDLLDREVVLVTTQALRPQILPNIEQEIIYVLG